MLFHTPTFVIFFLTFALFYFAAINKPSRLLILIVFSNVFYGWWDWRYLALLWLTILVDYFVAKEIGKTTNDNRRRLFLVSSLVTNLGILAVFKYFNFFVESVEALAGVNVSNWYLRELILPVGLSFYTFQSIAYIIDVYRKKQEPIQNLLQYAAYVCYFPQMVAGPIERAAHLLPQILNPAKITRERISEGTLLFCLGLFKKSLADTFAVMVNPAFQNIQAATPAEVVFAIFGFGLQIYLDFSGYIDMARGISKIMGIDLMLNFKTPYLSLSVKEFWRRWHISLSSWLRDYLYISLGGSRNGFAKHLSNLMITMVLGGLWHGAGLNFIIWGALHGGFLVINNLYTRCFPAIDEKRRFTLIARNIFSWACTFIAVNYAWLYFRCVTFSDAMVANAKIFSWLKSPEMPKVYSGVVVLIFIVLAIDVTQRLLENNNYKNIYRDSVVPASLQGVLAGIFLVGGIAFLLGVPTQQFIYFQF